MNFFPRNNTDEYVKKQVKKMMDEFIPLLREFTGYPGHTKPDACIELHTNQKEDIWYVKKSEKRGASHTFGICCAPMDMIRILTTCLLEAGFYLFYNRSEQIIYVQPRNICPPNTTRLIGLNYKSILE